jgi:hypothetical protein
MPAPKGNKYALGNEGGAPIKGLDFLWDGWYNDILNKYSEGASDVEIKAMIIRKAKKPLEGKKGLRMSNDLWDRWMRDYEEFSETITHGKIFSEAYLNELGRDNLQNKNFNYQGWYMQMKNRFGWMDKQHTDITSQGEKITPPIQWVKPDDKP